MDYQKYSQLTVAIESRVGTITLNRPDRLNAVNGVLLSELAHIFRDVEADSNIDIIILTGAGKAFSAGGDLEWMQDAIDRPDSFEQSSRDGKQIIFSILDCEKPIIAKVNGHAIGLGATLALFCDVIFASENAKFGDPHVSIGLVAGDGGAVIWPQLVGYARAKEYLMTGDLISATKAENIGLINHVVKADELDAAVSDFARRLAGGALKAIRWSKVSVNIGLKQLAHAIMDTSVAYEVITSASSDHAEAVAAFREKRQPKFSGT